MQSASRILSLRLLFLFFIFFCQNENKQAQAHLRGVSLLASRTTHILPSVPYYPVLISSSRRAGSSLVYFEQENSSLIVATSDSSGYFAARHPLQQQAVTNFLASAKLNNDNVDDFISVQREKNTIDVFLSSNSETTYTKHSYPVSFYPEKVVISDINNDRFPDILCVGKLSTGVAVLLGKKNATFQPVKTLFEDIPVDDVLITSINGDKIPDLILQNWLSNEVQVYIGFGKLHYSLQTSFQFGNDTTYVLAADYTNDGVIDLAIASSQNKVLRLLAGDGLGSFQEVQTLSLSVFPKAIFPAALQSASSNDIVLDNASEGIFSIVTMQQSGYWNDEVVYGCQDGPGKLLVGDVDGDGINEVIRLSRKKECEVFWKKQQLENGYSKIQSIAVGNNPNSLSVGDYNADGNLDIAVSNGGTSTMDILFNTQQNNFSQRTAFQVLENPTSIQWYSQNDSAVTFLLRHGNPLKVSIMTIESEKKSAHELYDDIISYVVPLQTRPSAIFPDVSLTETGIHFFVTNLAIDNTIVYFKQVAETRFVTKNLVPILPAKILGANIADLNADDHTDLLYTYFDDVVKKYYFGSTLNDSLDEFKGISQNVLLQNSEITKAIIQTEDCNGDLQKDFILNLLPTNTLEIILGQSNGNLPSALLIDTATVTSSLQDIQCVDFNQDGIVDILLLERISSTLFVYFGRGNGKFSKKISLSQLPEGAVFKCADFNNDGLMDILYTNPKKYFLTLRYGSN